MMRKLPLPSVTVVRTFSISAGLVTSTVTPGSTAPDVSVTTPATDALMVCASAHAAASATQTTRVKSLEVFRTPAVLRMCDRLLQPDYLAPRFHAACHLAFRPA